MEISGISGNFPNLMQQSSVSLTDEQKTTVEEILANYDPENMTREDMETLREDLEAAGIPKSKDVGAIMKEAGFEPPGGPQGPPPGPPPGESSGVEVDSELLTQLQELLDKVQSGDLSDEDLVTELDALLQSYSSATGNIVDGTA